LVIDPASAATEAVVRDGLVAEDAESTSLSARLTRTHFLHRLFCTLTTALTAHRDNALTNHEHRNMG
jgi:hypothetical protein